MLALIIGVFLWWDAHLFKRILPEQRTQLDAKLGAKAARALFASLIVLSVILMIFGYRSWNASLVYQAPATSKHFVMLIAWAGFILMGAGQSKSRIKRYIRHPMLIGASLWAIAHLLVRGDWASLWLFGGILAWAVFSILIINAREGSWRKPDETKLSLAGDIRLILIGSVLTAIAILIHIWSFGLIS